MRVLIALSEAKAEYTLYQIDHLNKPDWFTKLVNPVGKVSSFVLSMRTGRIAHFVF